MHSWGWEAGGGDGLCAAIGLADCVAAHPYNSASYGDLSGSSATFAQLGWINSVTAVPEPRITFLHGSDSIFHHCIPICVYTLAAQSC